jgi:hypothetical protein
MIIQFPSTKVVLERKYLEHDIFTLIRQWRKAAYDAGWSSEQIQQVVAEVLSTGSIKPFEDTLFPVAHPFQINHTVNTI